VVVVDETDTMLESGFAGDMAKLIHPLLYEPASNDEALRPTAPQFVMTTATLTPGVRRLLDPSSSPLRPGKAPPAFKLPPSLQTLAATGLHRVVPRLRQTFVDVGSHDKLSLLADVVSTGSRGAAPEARADPGAAEPLTVVFCNTVQSCRAAEHALAEGGIESECYHGDLNSKARSENLGRFREGEWSAVRGGGRRRSSMMTYKNSCALTIMRVAGSATSAMRKPQTDKRVRNDEA
jgi:superfamily II DNA/RNA helicase